MVIGLVIHTRATDKGRLQRNNIAAPAARNICEGSGTHIKNSPTRKAIDTDLRFICHKLGSWMNLPKIRSDFDWMIL